MEIEKFMTRRLYSVKPLDSIQHAREIMEGNRINQLPVVLNGRLVGIVTDRDLRDAFPSVFDSTFSNDFQRRSPVVDPSKITVETVMTPHAVALGPRDSMVDAARLMRRERIGAVPIVEDNRLIGIITRSDVLDAYVELAEPPPTPVKSGRTRQRQAG